MPKRFALFVPFLLAVLLSIGVMAWSSYLNAKKILKHEILEHQKTIAQETVDTIHTYFNFIGQNLQTLASFSPIQDVLDDPTPENIIRARQLLRNFLRHQNSMPNLTLVDSRGEALLSSTTGMPGLPQDHPVARSGPSFGSTRDNMGTPVTYMCTPVFEEKDGKQKHIGELLVVINLESLLRMWKNASSVPATDDYFHIIDGSGQLLASWNADEKPGAPLSAGKEEPLRHHQGSLVPFANAAGTIDLGVWFPIPSTDWRILMGMDRDNLLLPARTLRDKSFLISGIMGGLLLVAFWLMLHTLTRQLRRKNLQLDTVSTHLFGGLIITRLDPEFTLLYANDGFLRMLGCSPDYLREKKNSVLHLCPPEERGNIARTICGHFARGDSVAFEHRFIRRDGSSVWVLSRGHRVNDPEMGDVGVWVVVDISEQKEAQLAFERQSVELHALMDEVTASRERLQFLVDCAGTPLWSYDPESTLIDCNIHICRLLGWPETALRLTLEEFIHLCHPEDQGRLTAIFAAHKAGDGTATLEYECRIKDAQGYWRWLLIKGQGAINPVTGKCELVGIVIDNHARKLAALDTLQRAKELEAQVQARTAELAARNEELLKSQREALAATRAKSDFLATMSHEIRTPMNGIIGLTYLALQEKGAPSAHDYLNKIDVTAKTLLRIINDILDYSKVESGKMDFERVPFTLREVIDNTLEMFHPLVERKGLRLRLNMPEALPPSLLGDPTRLGQILINLVGNAVKFTHEGEVTLTIRDESRNKDAITLGFEVRDTGIGIPADTLPHLFSPFVQADMSVSRRYGGTGLGLAIVRALVQNMGGAVSVSSEPGKGTAFRFTLPFGLDRALPDETPAEVCAESVPLAGVRVLLAEDNEINQLVATEILRMEGVETDVAVNGLEAVRLARAGTYDAILMDVQMPELDGLEATRRIRVFLPDIPIIAMTAHTMKGDAEKCLEAGMQDHVSKPIQPEALFAALRKWVKG